VLLIVQKAIIRCKYTHSSWCRSERDGQIHCVLTYNPRFDGPALIVRSLCDLIKARNVKYQQELYVLWRRCCSVNILSLSCHLFFATPEFLLLSQCIGQSTTLSADCRSPQSETLPQNHNAQDPSIFFQTLESKYEFENFGIHPSENKIRSAVNNFADWPHIGAVMHYSGYVEPRDGAVSFLLSSQQEAVAYVRCI
jgi:hypothetical protein